MDSICFRLSFDYLVLATDISNKVLKKAETAIYTEENIGGIPEEIKKNSLLKSRERSNGLYKIGPEVRNNVKFRVLNLMDDDFKLREEFDIIFFRNVQIYFKLETRKKILIRILSYLKPGGHLFLGYSENISSIELDLDCVDQCIYRKPFYKAELINKD